MRRALPIFLTLLLPAWSAAAPAHARGEAGNPLADAVGLIVSGKHIEGETRLSEVLKAYELAGDSSGQATCRLFLGMSYFGRQNIPAAREQLELGARLFEAQKDPFGTWLALGMLGGLEENEGRLGIALAHHDRSLALLRGAAGSTEPLSFAGLKSFSLVLGIPSQAFDVLGLDSEELWPILLSFAEVASVVNRGGVLVELGRLEEAEAELSRASETSELLGGMFDTWMAVNVGNLRRRQGRLEEARESYRKALGGVISLPPFQTGHVEVNTLGHLAEIELITGNLEEALSLNNRALGLARRNGDVKREASILQDRANLLLRGQRSGEAAEVFARALALARDSNNVYRQAVVLKDLGLLSFTAGRYQEAVEHFESSIRLFRDLEEPLVEGPIWLFLSEAYFLLDAPDAARSALEKGRELARMSDFRLAGTLADLIEAKELLKSGQGSRDAAEQSFEAFLRIPEARGLLPDAEVLSSFRAMLQHGYPREGDTAKPVSDPEALARSGQPLLPDAARFLLGKLRFDGGDLEGARAIWLQALEANEHLNRDLKAGLLIGVSGIYLKEGKPDEAIRYLSSAVELVEGSDVTVEELMAGYLGGERHLYSEILVEMLIRQGRPQEAFEAAERARARAFLQQIGNRRLRPTDGGDPRLAQEAERLRVQIPILERQALLSPREDRERQEAGVALALARRRYQALLVRLKVSNSEYSAITRVETLEVRDLQQEIPPDATLISYFLSSRGVQAWVIDRETFQHVALPVQGDDLWRAVCWADQISRRGWEDGSRRGVTVPGPHCKAGAATSEEVYEKLIAPLRPHIRHQKLLIVPHHTLHYLPFAAMRDPRSRCYLAEQYTLTFLPSASALRFLRDKETPVEGRVLVLGDPASSRPDLRALPAAEKEADLVAKAFATSPVLGTQATESKLYRLNGSVDLLHIAAHGIYEPANPLFSRIALAPGEEHDGNLEVHEILGAVDLTGVNLVVLSACRTASGRRSGGDEIVGLTRAFLYAGSPGVVSTLWEIDDTASAVLMEDFYRHLREGAPAAEALRRAQLGLLASPIYSDPYYWAAFSLTGDPQGQW
jgi:CHAT domain-containing protein/ATP/maltotriose-dependent transcriptional regulator MalT